MRRFLIKAHWILSTQFGIDPLRFFRAIHRFPDFIIDWWRFRKAYSGRIMWVPCLHDRHEEGGTTKSEYFWQDLLVARWIHEAAPERHVDVGSRVDGFVAHVASFREIEIFDVRPITAEIPGITFTQVDLMDASSIESLIAEGGCCDSLSCLHALEHFGLGRYGDPIDPLGYRKGLKNLSRILSPGGTFYLSIPIGKERVEFNANWVFDPRNLVDAAKSTQLVLKKLIVFDPKQGPIEFSFDEKTATSLARRDYHLGIFVFIKVM